jgi:cell division septation protein DedD
VSDSARQSYYEIALTSRQVMTVFVVLLVAVLAAFLSGVWVGRQGSAPKVETVEAQAIEAAGEPADSPVERLDFFNRNDAVDDEGAPAADLPSEPAPPAADEPPIVAQAEAPAAAAPPAKKPPVKKPPAVEEPAAAAPEPLAAASTGDLVVQVFSSNNQVQAQAIVDQLRSGGYPALLSPVEVSGRTMYRVRIGPYADRKVAEGVAEQVRNKFRLETWITE